MAPSQVARAKRAASPSLRVKPGFEAKAVPEDENAKVNVDAHKTVDSMSVKSTRAEPVTSEVNYDEAPTADAAKPCQDQRKRISYGLSNLLFVMILAMTFAFFHSEIMYAMRSDMGAFALKMCGGLAPALGFALACVCAVRRCRARHAAKKTA